MKRITPDQLNKRMASLPMLSTVVSRLLALDCADDNYFEEVLSLSQVDPSFAVHLIKMSNSASLAGVEPVVSLRDAVVRLGTSNIASLITSLALLKVFEPSGQRVKQLWLHAIQVAITARVIACTTSSFNVNPEQTYLCGLLHDIGRFILIEDEITVPDTPPEKDRPACDKLIEMEESIYGVNHSKIGASICVKWDLPEILCQVVEFHHNFELPSDLNLQPKTLHLIKTTQIANLFSSFLTAHSENLEELVASQQDLSPIIEQTCIQFCQPAPVDAKQLELLIMPIWQESQEVAKGMGII